MWKCGNTTVMGASVFVVVVFRLNVCDTAAPNPTTPQN